jgi:hypothetical protein
MRSHANGRSVGFAIYFGYSRRRSRARDGEKASAITTTDWIDIFTTH